MSRLVSACLICCVSGGIYETYAEGLMESAEEFWPGDVKVVPAETGWPEATLYRYHCLLREDWAGYDYLFLCDADMRFVAPVEPRIFASLVATQHPGYLTRADLPYEDRPESAAYVRKGTTYYAGGFVGGEREAFLDLAHGIVNQIDRDDRAGIVARWHDESHLNAQLVLLPPAVTLPPSYCYPDDDSGYPWLKAFPRIIVAVDKLPHERVGR